jgi:Cu/Ag efflux protein CusF
MKNLILTGIILFLSLTVLAQTPAMFSYQAVIRNSESELLVNEDVNITVEIIKSSFDGDVVFSEEHQTTTNNYGLVSLKIGSVSPLNGIDWGADVYFVRISVDDVEMGTSQLLSVPYAMHAKTVDNMFSGNYSDLTGTPDLSDFITEIPQQSIGDLSDVDLNGLSDNKILKYNSGLGKWIAIDVAAASETDPEYNARPASAITNAGSGMVITFDERAKLAGIENGAEVNVNADWNAIEGDSQILNKPALSLVALSGNYNDLVNVPELFDGTWTNLSGKPVLSTVATTGNYNDLTNTPDLFDGTWLSLTGKPNLSTVATTGNYNDLTNTPDLFDGTWVSLTGKPNLSTVATSGNYTDLNGLPSLFDGTWASLSGKPSLSTVATTGDYTDLSNRPVTITPAQAAAIDANTLKRSYPIVDETKLAGIQAGAEVNVNADWNAVAGDAQILNKPVMSSWL